MSTVAVSSGSVVAATVTSGVSVAAAAVVGVGIASYRAYQYVSEQAEEFIAKNNEMIDRLDSPQAMAELAERQHSWLMKDPFFVKQTSSLTATQKEQLAGAYVTANTPLEATFSEMVIKNSSVPSFSNMVSVATAQFAKNNFMKVASTLEMTATEFGFNQKFLRFSNENSKVLTFQKKGSEEQMTVVVSKDPQNQATTMAIDLHGFDCNTDRCMDVMNEFENRLKEKGLKFSFRKERHNLPEGKLLNKLKTTKRAEKTSRPSGTRITQNKKITQ